MAEVILITGGSRSGKSDYAQKMAEECLEEKIFLATCPEIDLELKIRISRHKEKRIGKRWQTIEEEVDIAGVILKISQNNSFKVILIDCLTLWTNNLLFNNQNFDEQSLQAEFLKLNEALDSFEGKVIMVTNEVGLGIVAVDPLTRRYVDLLGKLNCWLADKADLVVLMVSGLPIVIKENKLMC